MSQDGPDSPIHDPYLISPSQQAPEPLQAVAARFPKILVLQALLVALVAAGATGLLLAAFLSGSQSRYSEISAHEVRTVGTVDRVDLSNHGTVYFTFSVGPATHQAASLAGEPNANASSLRPGDAISVFYDSRDPGQVVAFDPAQQLDTNRTFVPAGALLVGITAGVVFAVARKTPPRVA